MADYDFYTLFDSLEFQDFARDMVQIREGITFESFARGTDLGIDGRYVLKDGSVIIFQAKSIRNTRWTQCIYSLSMEIKKMQLYQGISPHSL